MLKEQFSEVMPFLSAGLVGSGSEVLGYDDEISEDHDFEPGFCLLLPGEDIIDRRTAFLLERAYAKLPKEFMGYQRSMIGPVGGARHGVLRMDEFFQEKIGSPDGILSVGQWLSLPEQTLAEVTGGVVHCYSYSAELAKEFVKMGFYIGIGGVVTFKNAKKIVEVVNAIPLEHIVLETDCPYLAPVPYRGKRNSSMYLPYVVRNMYRL